MNEKMDGSGKTIGFGIRYANEKAWGLPKRVTAGNGASPAIRSFTSQSMFANAEPRLSTEGLAFGPSYLHSEKALMIIPKANSYHLGYPKLEAVISEHELSLREGFITTLPREPLSPLSIYCRQK